MDSKDLHTDLHQYMELRTMLDSVDMGALRFYLGAADHACQQENFKYLKAELMKISDHVWGLPKVKPDVDPCPEGYHLCDGCCVPYPCVG